MNLLLTLGNVSIACKWTIGVPADDSLAVELSKAFRITSESAVCPLPETSQGPGKQLPTQRRACELITYRSPYHLP